MSRLTKSLSSEIRKVRSTKLWWILAIVLVAYSAFLAALFAFLFSSMGEVLGGSGIELPAQQAANLVYSTVSTSGYVIPLLFGALMATGEIRHRTLALTFTLEPKRGIVLLSKTLVLFGVGLVIGIAGLIGAVGTGAVVLELTGGQAMLGAVETWMIIARVLAAMAVWAIIGFGVGILVRNQAFAIVLTLIFTQFIEPILRTVAQFLDWSAQVAKYLPGAATDAFVGGGSLGDLSTVDPSVQAGATPLGIWAGLAVLLGYAAVAVFAGWLLRWRKDVA